MNDKELRDRMTQLRDMLNALLDDYDNTLFSALRGGAGGDVGGRIRDKAAQGNFQVIQGSIGQDEADGIRPLFKRLRSWINGLPSPQSISDERKKEQLQRVKDTEAPLKRSMKKMLKAYGALAGTYDAGGQKDIRLLAHPPEQATRPNAKKLAVEAWNLAGPQLQEIRHYLDTYHKDPDGSYEAAVAETARDVDAFVDLCRKIVDMLVEP